MHKTSPHPSRWKSFRRLFLNSLVRIFLYLRKHAAKLRSIWAYIWFHITWEQNFEWEYVCWVIMGTLTRSIVNFISWFPVMPLLSHWLLWLHYWNDVQKIPWEIKSLNEIPGCRPSKIRNHRGIQIVTFCSFLGRTCKLYDLREAMCHASINGILCLRQFLPLKKCCETIFFTIRMKVQPAQCRIFVPQAFLW